MRRWLIGLESFVAIAAIAGGFLLAVAPDGHLLDAHRSALDGSPFTDWRVPGLLLLALVGGGFALAAWGEWRQVPRAASISIVAGTGLIAFEIVEALWIGPQPLQAVFALVGLAVVAFVVAVRHEPPLPSTRATDPSRQTVGRPR
ncbi:MAG: hypothetical protein ACTHMS_20110 [Jatrophihabitans sp.]|uniref:hypothetical protein n=1 Tax=Jatrophihabitans sp. TaxID=1932789 RepID=UPI003F8103F3